MKQFLIKTIAKTWLSGPRYWWSSIYRLKERQFKGVELPRVWSFSMIEDALGKVIWTQDNYSMLFDAISTYQKVWATKMGDCDDFATLAIAFLKQLGCTGYYYTYVGEDWMKAHTICVFIYKGCWFYFDNHRLVKTDITKFSELKLRFAPVLADDVRSESFGRVVLV